MPPKSYEAPSKFAYSLPEHVLVAPLAVSQAGDLGGKSLT